MDILKFNRSKSVNVFEFFLSLFEKKKICCYLRTLERLFDYAITFEKETNWKSRIFTKNKKKTNKDYILKSLFFDGNRLVQKQAKEFDYKNVIFIKYQGNFVLYKLNITKAYYDKISNTNDKRNAYEFCFNIVFPNPTKVKHFMFVKRLGIR